MSFSIRIFPLRQPFNSSTFIFGGVLGPAALAVFLDLGLQKQLVVIRSDFQWDLPHLCPADMASAQQFLVGMDV